MVSKWKMPPKAKIYEALSAVVDHRVSITGAMSAQVLSSARDKTYDVTWSEDFREIGSNDNASYWQGYIGYPIIAVLLKVGRLPFTQQLAGLLAGVKWKEINDQYKRDYDKAITHVLEEAGASQEERAQLALEVQGILEHLAALGLHPPKERRPPPKGRQV